MGSRSMWSKKNIAILFEDTRGGKVVDKYLAGYDGILVSDKYSTYKRFDPGGKHQLCW